MKLTKFLTKERQVIKYLAGQLAIVLVVVAEALAVEWLSQP